MTEQTVNATFGPKEKVQIVLQEYGTLRTELIHRGNNMFQLLAVVVAITVWLCSRPIDTRFWVLLAIAVAAFSTFGWILHRDVEKAAERVREIEAYVNTQVGEPVLQWETLWGGAVTGYLGPARPLKLPERPN
jgi:hypothetical protein